MQLVATMHTNLAACLPQLKGSYYYWQTQAANPGSLFLSSGCEARH
jgi:uncharacterized protein involved in tolerance to divalent cations